MIYAFASSNLYICICMYPDIVKGSLNPEWNCCWELYMMKKPDQIKVKVRDADLPAMSKLCVPQNCFFNGKKWIKGKLFFSEYRF